jgi:hypothetical protein
MYDDEQPQILKQQRLATNWTEAREKGTIPDEIVSIVLESFQPDGSASWIQDDDHRRISYSPSNPKASVTS